MSVEKNLNERGDQSNRGHEREEGQRELNRENEMPAREKRKKNPEEEPDIESDSENQKQQQRGKQNKDSRGGNQGRK